MSRTPESPNATAPESHTVDCTPSWTGVLPIPLHLAQGTPRQQRVAREEFYKMAEAADNWTSYLRVTEGSCAHSGINLLADGTRTPDSVSSHE